MLSRGASIDRFRLEESLGSGGMGVVWSARDTATNGRVALKFLHPGLLARADARARLRREALASRLVGHAGIVPVREVVETDGLMFLVMDLLQGETLRARLVRSGQLPVATACAMLAEVADVLRVAHRVGIIHRDLKPENIFLRCGGADDVRVLDFGVAKLELPDAGTPLTGIDTVLGTIAYMAPEQLTRASAVDGRADVWALGVVLYESLVGFRPIEGADRNELIRRVLTEGITPVSALVAGVPDELGRLTTSMLSRPPERRPALDGVHALLRRLAALDH
jgi:eukaryotic-like serine/threonine-protein kinase